MIKILVADDHPLIRQGVKQIISENTAMTIIAEAASGLEVLEKLRKTDCDVVLLDLSMPGMSGLDILKQIKKEKPAVNVLILSRYPEEQYALSVLKAGASGYVQKTSIVEELTDAIQEAAAGEKHISPAMAQRLAGELTGVRGKTLEMQLSSREMEIMCLIASGKSIREIADKLSLSSSTVSTYRSRIMQKMKMKSDAEIVRYAMENELIE